MKLSLVIPVYNEEQNIEPLVQAIEEALKGLVYEIVFVDDGSTDGTVRQIKKLDKKNVRLLVFARNFGQTSAMAAGIETARGEYIATLDGDLQNDPSDIPAMLEKLETEGFDLVAGRRADRRDGMFLRKLPSRIANMLIRYTSKVTVQDYGCTLKVFRATLAKNLDLYGELHRFIPILAHLNGARIAEVDVKHHARKFGVSKYGIGRTLKVLSDLLLMLFFLKYRQRPMHLFGTLGLGILALGGLIEAYLLLEKIAGHDIGHRPLFYVGILFIIAGVQLVTTGFIAELLMRTYYGSQNKRPYVIAKRYETGKEID